MVYSESNREIATLNINQPISAILAVNFLPQEDKDILIIGTETHILAYHVHDNKDIFYKECPDGAKSIAVGFFRDVKNPILMVGGNSSVHGYDHEGNEIFWSAVGDVVTSIIMMDYNKDGSNEVISIRAFSQKSRHLSIWFQTCQRDVLTKRHLTVWFLNLSVVTFRARINK